MRTMLSLIATSTALVAVSEALYYRVDTVAPTLIAYYALPAACFLWALRRYQVDSLAGVALAGAIFGFAVEGLLVPVVYEAPLVTISYPSLGWHMLVPVMVCWWALGRRLREGSAAALARWMLGFGVFLGAWWPTWWQPGREQIDWSPLTLTGYIALGTLGLVAGHAGMALAPVPTDAPSRLHNGLLGGIALFFLIAMSVQTPIAIVMLPLLLLVCHWGLSRARGDGSTLGRLSQPVVWSRFGLFVLVPLGAGVSYGLLDLMGNPAAVTDLSQSLLGGGSFVAGYAVLLWALVRRRAVRGRVGRAGAQNPRARSGRV